MCSRPVQRHRALYAATAERSCALHVQSAHTNVNYNIQTNSAIDVSRLYASLTL